MRQEEEHRTARDIKQARQDFLGPRGAGTRAVPCAGAAAARPGAPRRCANNLALCGQAGTKTLKLQQE